MTMLSVFNQTDKISIESFSTKRVWSLDLLISYYLHLLTFQNGVQAQAYSGLFGSFHRGRKYISSYFPFLATVGTTGSPLRCSRIVFLAQQSSLRNCVHVTSLSELMVCLLFICALQYGSHQPHVAEARCAGSIQHTPDFEDLVQ